MPKRELSAATLKVREYRAKVEEFTQLVESEELLFNRKRKQKKFSEHNQDLFDLIMALLEEKNPDLNQIKTEINLLQQNFNYTYFVNSSDLNLAITSLAVITSFSLEATLEQMILRFESREYTVQDLIVSLFLLHVRPINDLSYYALQKVLPTLERMLRNYNELNFDPKMQEGHYRKYSAEKLKDIYLIFYHAIAEHDFEYLHEVKHYKNQSLNLATVAVVKMFALDHSYAYCTSALKLLSKYRDMRDIIESREYFSYYIRFKQQILYNNMLSTQSYFEINGPKLTGDDEENFELYEQNLLNPENLELMYDITMAKFCSGLEIKYFNARMYFYLCHSHYAFEDHNYYERLTRLAIAVLVDYKYEKHIDLVKNHIDLEKEGGIVNQKLDFLMTYLLTHGEICDFDLPLREERGYTHIKNYLLTRDIEHLHCFNLNYVDHKDFLYAFDATNIGFYYKGAFNFILAAIVKLNNLDAKLFKSNPFFPYECVKHYKQSSVASFNLGLAQNNVINPHHRGLLQTFTFSNIDIFKKLKANNNYLIFAQERFYHESILPQRLNLISIFYKLGRKASMIEQIEYLYKRYYIDFFEFDYEDNIKALSLFVLYNLDTKHIMQALQRQRERCLSERNCDWLINFLASKGKINDNKFMIFNRRYQDLKDLFINNKTAHLDKYLNEQETIYLKLREQIDDGSLEQDELMALEYFGALSFEAAAMVKLMGLDPQGFSYSPHFPLYCFNNFTHFIFTDNLIKDAHYYEEARKNISGKMRSYTNLYNSYELAQADLESFVEKNYFLNLLQSYLLDPFGYSKVKFREVLNELVERQDDLSPEEAMLVASLVIITDCALDHRGEYIINEWSSNKLDPVFNFINSYGIEYKPEASSKQYAISYLSEAIGFRNPKLVTSYLDQFVPEDNHVFSYETMAVVKLLDMNLSQFLDHPYIDVELVQIFMSDYIKDDFVSKHLRNMTVDHDEYKKARLFNCNVWQYRSLMIPSSLQEQWAQRHKDVYADINNCEDIEDFLSEDFRYIMGLYASGCTVASFLKLMREHLQIFLENFKADFINPRYSTEIYFEHLQRISLCYLLDLDMTNIIKEHERIANASSIFFSDIDNANIKEYDVSSYQAALHLDGVFFFIAHKGEDNDLDPITNIRAVKLVDLVNNFTAVGLFNYTMSYAMLMDDCDIGNYFNFISPALAQIFNIKLESVPRFERVPYDVLKNIKQQDLVQ